MTPTTRVLVDFWAPCLPVRSSSGCWAADCYNPRMPTGRRIKLYGERNTGTRYLAGLLRHNLSSELLPGAAPRRLNWSPLALTDREGRRDAWFEARFAETLGWKHMQVDVGRLLALGRAVDDVQFVALVKNPYAWLLSLRARPYHRRGGGWRGSAGLRTLLTTAWPTVGRENGPPAYMDAIDLWNRKLRAYLELAEHFPVTLVTYERLVSEPAAILERVRRDAACEWKRGRFENLPASTKETGKDWQWYRDYYSNERWRAGLDDDIARLVNERVDRTLMDRCGYALIGASATGCVTGH